jgi:methylmalonyl-CoA/ethylmalonyl-CoA epimerase
MFESFDHVGIVVASLDEAIAEYRAQFDMEVVRRERVEEHAVEIAMLEAGTGRVELLAPLPGDSMVAKFLDSHGPGLHHLAYRVPDIDAALATLRERNVALIDEQARGGFAGTRIAFVDPRVTGGVLTELVEAAAA